jgi:hypothetical protein
MASDFLRFQQDPSWGNMFSGLASDIADAPGKALSQKLQVEHIVALRQKQAQDKADYDAKVAAGETTSTAIGGITPPMSERQIPYQPEGPVNPADNPTGAPMTLPQTDTTVSQQYLDPAVEARYKRELPMLQAGARAVARTNPADIPKFYSQSAFGLGGVPKSLEDQQRLSAMTRGTYEAPKLDNYVAKTQDGKVVMLLGPSPDGIHTPDGRLLKDIAPPGSVPMKTGEVAANEKPHSIFENDGTRMAAIMDGTNAVVAGKLPNPADTRNLAVAIRQQFPEINKLMSDAVGNTAEFRNYIEKEAPPEIQPLLRHIVNTLPEYQQQATAAPAPGADPAAVAAAQPPPLQAPGTRAPGGPQPNVLVNAPANQYQNHLAAAVQRADTARQQIMTMVYNGQPLSGTLPKDPYVPDWMAALIAERQPDGVVSAMLMNKVDPKAREYYSAAKAFVEPVLRLASGAAIRPEEYKDYMYMFVPGFGDSPQLIATKLNRMREWQEATAGNATANQATATMIAKAQARGDTEAVRLAGMMKVRAQQAGTGDRPATTLPGAQAPAATGGADDPLTRRGNAAFGITPGSTP